MVRRVLAFLAMAAAVLTGGWIFRRAPTMPQDALHSTSRGDSQISVRRHSSAAFDAASQSAAELVSAGWTESPVSAGTFHLLTRDGDVVAIVAEDLPSGGSRITTLHRRHALW